MGIEADLRDAQEAGAESCGLPVTSAAFRTLQDAWFTEIGAHATVLEQLCQALRNSATTYQETDQNAAQGFGTQGFKAGADNGQ